jgi:hypothetical protein
VAVSASQVFKIFMDFFTFLSMTLRRDSLLNLITT